MREASTDASQNINLKEKISTQTNHIEESEPRMGINAGSNLSEQDKKKKRVDELSESYKPRVPFPSILEADSSPSVYEKLVTSEYTCLESSDTLLVPIASNLIFNLKT